jgi:hypothetical protein
VESMNKALRQMNGQLPPPVPTRAPALDGRGLILGAVDELARRLKIRGLRITKLEREGAEYVVTYQGTERFRIDDE